MNALLKHHIKFQIDIEYNIKLKIQKKRKYEKLLLGLGSIAAIVWCGEIQLPFYDIHKDHNINWKKITWVERHYGKF